MENDVRKDGVCSVYIWWWLNVKESSLRVCSELCSVSFHIFVNVCLFCCSLYLVRVLIVMNWEGDLSLLHELCARLCCCIMLWKLL